MRRAEFNDIDLFYGRMSTRSVAPCRNRGAVAQQDHVEGGDAILGRLQLGAFHRLWFNTKLGLRATCRFKSCYTLDHFGFHGL